MLDGESPAGERAEKQPAAPALASPRVTAEEQEMIAGEGGSRSEPLVDPPEAEEVKSVPRRSFWSFGEPAARQPRTPSLYWGRRQE
jgi:hypothetical protein